MNSPRQDPPRLRFAVAGVQRAPRRIVLPIAEAAEDFGPLTDGNGAPVWPIRGPEEGRVLDEVVRLFGGTTEAVAARRCDAPAEGSEGSVVGIGDLQAEASLYAHLTDRCVEPCNTVVDLNPDALPDVLLYCGLRLDRGLVQILQVAKDRGAAVGIIWGRTRDELRIQVLCRACAAYLNGPAAVPELSVSEAGLNDGAEGDKPLDALRRRLGEGVGILQINGHCDGLFQWIGHGAALCPRGAEPDAGDSRAAPQCIETNFCHRLNEPLEKVSRENRLIPPSSISARVVVHLSCHSAFLGCSAIDPAWALLPGLATNPYIGALVTTPRLAFTHEDILNTELSQYLKLGSSVGEAIAKLQENPTIREIGYQPLLFGDPRVAGGPQSAARLIRRDPATRQASPSVSPVFSPEGRSDRLLSDIELIRSLSKVALAGNPKASETSDELRQQLLMYEHAEGDDTRTQERELQLAVLRHLGTGKVRLYEGWQRIAHIEEIEDLELCQNCTWTGRPRFVTLPSGGEREFFDCPGCGDVYDRPVEDHRLGMSADSGAFYLDDAVDRKNSVAAAYVVRLGPKETQTLEWPLGDERLPQSRMSIDLRALQKGPVKVYAVLMEGVSLYSQAFRARAGA